MSNDIWKIVLLFLVSLPDSRALTFGLPGRDLNQCAQSAGFAILQSHTAFHYLEQSSPNDYAECVEVGSSTRRRLLRIEDSLNILHRFSLIVYLNSQGWTINSDECPDTLAGRAPAQ